MGGAAQMSVFCRAHRGLGWKEAFGFQGSSRKMGREPTLGHVRYWALELALWLEKASTCGCNCIDATAQTRDKG